MFKLDFYYDVETAPSFIDEDQSGDVWTISGNGEISQISDTSWSVAFDVAFGDNPNGYQYFFLSTIRYDFISHQSFASVMFNYFDENYDRRAINRASLQSVTLFDNKRFEIAAAYTWHATELLQLSAEVLWLQSSVDNEDEFGLFAQAVFDLP